MAGPAPSDGTPTVETLFREAAGRAFYKLCGSGNDFVFLDGFHAPIGALGSAEAIRALCARATGIGADGVVLLEPPGAEGDGAAFRMRYHNSDGSRATLCGNAALCATRLAVELGIADPRGFAFDTDAGRIAARMRGDLPEIDLQPVTGLVADAGIAPTAGEARIGFATAGVPHLVVRVDDVAVVDLPRRGRELRHDPSLADGANVNFVSPVAGGWRMRTYERGVEGETLACGTGAVACAAILDAWGAASGDETTIVTSSGRPLHVRRSADEGRGPALAGEGRLVFRGVVAELV